jgi:hypothetical protein
MQLFVSLQHWHHSWILHNALYFHSKTFYRKVQKLHRLNIASLKDRDVYPLILTVLSIEADCCWKWMGIWWSITENSRGLFPLSPITEAKNSRGLFPLSPITEAKNSRGLFPLSPITEAKNSRGLFPLYIAAG